MKISKKKSPAAKSRPLKPQALRSPPVEEVEDVPVVDEVPDVEQEQKEAELSDLQRTLAETEARIENLNLEIEAKVQEKVQQAIESIGPFLQAAEFRIAEKLIAFFMQSPMWEVEKVVKAAAGATAFYNPYELFRKLTSQGWKYMGPHFDEKKKETYELFVRQKGLPKSLKDYMKFYAEFAKEADKPFANTLAEAKAEDTKQRRMLIKPATKK